MHQTFERLFIDYCAYFNGNADYFECHEVLEELWKDVAPGDKEHVLVGLIQVATGLYHWRRGNYRGAQKALTGAVRILENAAASPYFAFVTWEPLMDNVRASLRHVECGDAFKGFDLTFGNTAFANVVVEQIATLPVVDAEFILHKHTLRDRSDVIAARLERLAEKDR